MKPETHPAEVIEVAPSDIRESDPFTGKRSDYGNFVRVRETNTGVEHIMRNGSMNQVAPQDRVVGRKGTVSWMRGSYYNLPIFQSQQ